MKVTEIELKNDGNSLICSTCLFSDLAYYETETIIYCNYYEKEITAKPFESFLTAKGINKDTKKPDFCKIESIIIREVDNGF